MGDTKIGDEGGGVNYRTFYSNGKFNDWTPSLPANLLGHSFRLKYLILVYGFSRADPDKSSKKTLSKRQFMHKIDNALFGNIACQ